MILVSTFSTNMPRRWHLEMSSGMNICPLYGRGRRKRGVPTKMKTAEHVIQTVLRW
jgi:hypothetical protein